MLRLKSEDYELDLVPETGGGIARFDWRGVAVLRPQCGPSPLDLASFPLVPYSNRIADGRFAFNGRKVQIAPNWPAVDARNPLHGLGWLSAWETVACTADRAVLVHRHDGGPDWPWPYRATQTFALDGRGLSLTLVLENIGDGPMPAGLGFHPYFPRDGQTRYLGLHRTEWVTGADGLPIGRSDRPQAVDWWRGAPVGARIVDTVYGGRTGDLQIVQPTWDMMIRLSASANLGFTVVYVPQGQAFFCVEPVSHATDSFNADPNATARRSIAPGACSRAHIDIEVCGIRGI